MAHLTLQPQFQEAIAQLGEQIELRNSSGQPVGYYISLEAYNKLRFHFVASLVSDEELEVARQQPGGRTTQEVLERLDRVTK